MSSRPFDVAVIGAGAAGMMAAAVAGQRGLRVVLIDHAGKLAEKIRISGGGRCNFTNIGTTPANFISRNPHFCRSALAAYTPQDFIQLLGRYGVTWHEKHRGQLFCDDSSEEVIRVLRAECERGAVAWRMPCAVQGIEALSGGGFSLTTSQGSIKAGSVVLATGGMAIPQLGATDYALQVARQFGLKIVEPRPALVPLTFDGEFWKPFSGLSGVALEVTVTTPASAGAAGKSKGGKARDPSFLEDLLFTHRGLSGPAILQISSYWNPGQPLHLNLAPGQRLDDALIQAKPGNRQQLASALAGLWPRRLADVWLQQTGDPELPARRMADVPDRVLRDLGSGIHDWVLVPSGTGGYRKAEVMRGGVDTAELDQKTMESRRVPGLYVVGEAVDVTGWLGGYNFQWAWASGVACGRALRPLQA